MIWPFILDEQIIINNQSIILFICIIALSTSELLNTPVNTPRSLFTLNPSEGIHPERKIPAPRALLLDCFAAGFSCKCGPMIRLVKVCSKHTRLILPGGLLYLLLPLSQSDRGEKCLSVCDKEEKIHFQEKNVKKQKKPQKTKMRVHKEAQLAQFILIAKQHRD